MPPSADPTAVATPHAPRAIGPYAQASVGGGLVFCSGQIGIDPGTGRLVEGGVVAEAERALANLAAVLEAAGTDVARVTKTTIYLTDIGDFAAVNEAYARWLGDARPARATVAVSALPKGARVEIDAVALAPQGSSGASGFDKGPVEG